MITSIFLILSAGITLLLIRKKFSKSIVRLAKQELAKWQGLKELSQNASQILVKYWKSVGLNFSVFQMQNPTVQKSYPWSSAFISYLFFKSGAKEKFPYSSSHAGYFQVAKQNRGNKSAPLRGFRINEYAPKLGDLVVYSRQKGKGYDSTGFFASHGELVVEVGKGYIKTIGGNVGNTVKESKYSTDLKGYLKGNRVSFFMVIKNNIR